MQLIISVFPLYPDGTTGDMMAGLTAPAEGEQAASAVGELIVNAARRAADMQPSEGESAPEALDITVELCREGA